MTLDQLFLVILVVVLTYYIGRATMLRDIIKHLKAEEAAENEPNGSVNELSVEKVDNIYYAYLGTKFAGQADNFDDLIKNMIQNKKHGIFVLKSDQNLSAEEKTALASAIYKNCEIK